MLGADYSAYHATRTLIHTHTNSTFLPAAEVWISTRNADQLAAHRLLATALAEQSLTGPIYKAHSQPRMSLTDYDDAKEAYLDTIAEMEHQHRTLQ